MPFFLPFLFSFLSFLILNFEIISNLRKPNKKYIMTYVYSSRIIGD